jgi:hypothetical protein
MAQWSYKDQRKLMELAATSEDLETIAAGLKRSPEAILRMARQLGIKVKSRRRRGNE